MRTLANAIAYYSYGISTEEIQLIIQNQNYCCAICHRHLNEVRRCEGVPIVDHDPDTGMVRGILCKKCDAGIDMLGDTLACIREAVKYLENRYGALPP